jgi:hypothetical protein
MDSQEFQDIREGNISWDDDCWNLDKRRFLDALKSAVL